MEKNAIISVKTFTWSETQLGVTFEPFDRLGRVRCQNRGFLGQEIDWEGSQWPQVKGRRPIGGNFDWSVTFEPFDGFGRVRCLTRGFLGQEIDWEGPQWPQVNGRRPIGGNCRRFFDYGGWKILKILYKCLGRLSSGCQRLKGVGTMMLTSSPL